MAGDFRKLHEDRGGFTLIELIVALLVSTVVLLSLAVMVSSALNMFRVGSNDSVVVTESDTVMDQVSQQIMEAVSKPVVLNANGFSGCVMDVVMDDGSRGICVIALDETDSMLLEGRFTPAELKDSTSGPGISLENVVDGTAAAATTGSAINSGNTTGSAVNTSGSAVSNGSKTSGPETYAEQIKGAKAWTLLSWLIKDEQVRKYMLSQMVTDITIGAPDKKGLVDVSVTVESGDRTRTVNGRYWIRNWDEI